MTIDYSALLYDPVYAELGVEATLTIEGTAGGAAITVIDDTRPKTITSGSSEVRSVGPGAYARIPELAENGITRDDYLGAVLEFNGRAWAVRSYELRGSPNGEDVGEVRFFLKAAESIGISGVTIARAGSAAGIGNARGAIANTEFWTLFNATEPSGEGSAFVGAGTRKIYVSATGNNSNPGTQAAPKLTLQAGVNLLRDGKPDWLLLKKGDTWTQEQISFNDKSGVSETEPMLISTYGTGSRPRIQTSGSLGAIYLGFGGTTDFIAVVGLETYAHKRDPDSPDFNIANVTDEASGIQYQSSGTWFLMEDCKVSFYADNVSLTGSLAIAKMRRCIVHDSYSGTASHSLGLFVSYVDTPVLEECVFHHCGWNETVGSPADGFNRNVYFKTLDDEAGSETGPAIVTGCFISHSSSEGLQLRSGGTLIGNFFYGNSSGFDVGHQFDDHATVGITSATASGNIVMRSSDAAAGRNGYGIVILNATTSGIQVIDNIVTKWDSGSDARAFYLDAQTAGCVVTGNIIFDYIDPGSENGIHDLGVGNITSPNDIDIGGTNNNPGGLAPNEPFSAPDRELGDYYLSVGGTNSAPAFITALLGQSKDNWNPDLTATKAVNYIRAGFDLDPV